MLLLSLLLYFLLLDDSGAYFRHIASYRHEQRLSPTGNRYTRSTLSCQYAVNPLFEAGFNLELPNNINIVSSEYDIPLDTTDANTTPIDGKTIIKLNNIANGWGSGSHPTTFLCLEFLSENLVPGMKLLDYGAGSGILSIYAAKLGASQCVGVEVDDDAIESATANCKLNNVDKNVQIIHTKEVFVGDSTFPMFDITVANILAGALTRLVGPICGFTKPGSFICLSGVRPWELAGVKRFYEPFIVQGSDKTKALSHPVFGEWVRWTAQMKEMSKEEKLTLMNNLMDAGLQ